MIYKKFKDKELSWLGMGVMRMPTTEPGGPIDEEKAVKLIDHAYNNGVNYFDTSYFYHGGDSERFIGKALSRYPRDSWYLADKMPGNMMTYADGKLSLNGFGMDSWEISGAADVFDYQLNKCGVDYFDFYLLHNVSETTYGIYTNEELAIVDYLIDQKRAGRIKHLGFSAHGRAETIESFLKYLESKGFLDYVEFFMIQLNYLDWTLQGADRKYELLTKYNMPVFVMEPTRGGKLCNLKDAADNLLKSSRPSDSQASWAFRYLQSLDNVALVLSGMTTMEQLEENIEIFDTKNPITSEEKTLLDKVVETIAELAPCTACRYCVDICPKGLDIPLLLSMYNEAAYEVSWTIRSAINALDANKTPADCITCGLCNPLCPQEINIPSALKKFDKLLAV